jgi:ADP-heptose:LPS heptosyltransferase
LKVSDFHRLGEPFPQRIAIVRALRGLGDLLCAVPAWRALRAALPQAHITLVGLPWARAFVERYPAYLDDLLEFPGYPGIPERTPPIAELPAFFAGANARRFDLALQMHGSGVVSNPFTVMLGARHNAGFYLPGQYCPDPERFLAYPDDEPEVWRHLRLMEFLGVPLHGAAMEFPLWPEDWDALDATLSTTGAKTQALRDGAYACLHAGAAEPQRRWPPERFAAVADGLVRQGLQVVLTGTEAERGVAQQVADHMQAPALNLAGLTSLGGMAALLSRARLLVSNDTGVSHLAAALRVPSVVIFIASEPERWAPLDRRLHRVVGRPSGRAEAGEDGMERGQPVTLHLEPDGGSLAVASLGAGLPPRHHRCLREGCMLPEGGAQLLPTIEATPGAVLAQARELLMERAHA